jgi:hypothetical protein
VKKFWTLAEISEHTMLKRPMLRYQIKSGNLKAERIGGRQFITTEELRRFLGPAIFDGSFDDNDLPPITVKSAKEG